MLKEMHQDKLPEPIELRLLKQKLACFACKCLNCEKYNRYRSNKVKSGESTGVQVDQTNLDRFSKATQDRTDDQTKKIDKATGNSFISILCNDYICPSCKYIVEFLRGHLNKVFKDVESETKPLAICDKSTEKTIDRLDKTTSMIKKCNSSCAMKKQLSAELIKSDNKERKSEKVVFIDSVKDDILNVGNDKRFNIEKDKKLKIEKDEKPYIEKDKITEIEKQTSVDAERTIFLDSKNSTGRQKQYMCGNCVCVEKFINAIRPYA